MNNEEEKFEQFVTSIRFDDTPSDAHRDQLEKQLLAAWDETQAETETDTDNLVIGPAEPTRLYVRRLAVAASFLIVCGTLFWGIDRMFIGEQSYMANRDDWPTIKQLIEKENVSGTEKKQLVAQIRNICKMMDNKDSAGLVTALQANENAYTVRVWAAKYLGKRGGEETLERLETAIDKLGVTDPKDPLMIAADKIRDRLGLEKPAKPAQTDTDTPSHPTTNGSFQAAPNDCEPELD